MIRNICKFFSSFNKKKSQSKPLSSSTPAAIPASSSPPHSGVVTEQYSQPLCNELITILKQDSHFTDLYLYGSRAKLTYRPDSDHDFFAVFDDQAANAMSYKSVDNATIRNRIKKQIRKKGLPTKYDLMMERRTDFNLLAKQPNSHADQCIKIGIKLY